MNTSHKLLLALALAASLAACKKDEPVPPPVVDIPAVTPTPPVAPAPSVAITKVDLGTAVGADMTIAAPTSTFKPSDTIYAAVTTTGTAPSALVKAKWSFSDNSVVNETTTELKDLAGVAVTDFHIAKPDGWPVGKYKVEISVDDKPPGVTEFTVAK